MMKICTYHKYPFTYASLVNTQRQCYSKVFNEKIQPILIVASIENKLSPEMDALRLRCFPGVIPLDTSRDEFDDRSEHLVIKIQEIIAAYGRLTPGPNAVFETWTQGRATIPTGPHVCDLGRCLVNPQYQGLGLLELICLLGVMKAKEQGYQYVVGTYAIGSKVGPKVHKIGFSDSGTPVNELETGGVNVLVQPVVNELGKTAHLWQGLFHKNKAFLASKGYLLKE